MYHLIKFNYWINKSSQYITIRRGTVDIATHSNIYIKRCITSDTCCSSLTRYNRYFSKNASKCIYFLYWHLIPLIIKNWLVQKQLLRKLDQFCSLLFLQLQNNITVNALYCSKAELFLVSSLSAPKYEACCPLCFLNYNFNLIRHD